MNLPVSLPVLVIIGAIAFYFYKKKGGDKIL